MLYHNTGYLIGLVLGFINGLIMGMSLKQLQNKE